MEPQHQPSLERRRDAKSRCPRLNRQIHLHRHRRELYRLPEEQHRAGHHPCRRRFQGTIQQRPDVPARSLHARDLRDRRADPRSAAHDRGRVREQHLLHRRGCLRRPRRYPVELGRMADASPPCARIGKNGRGRWHEALHAVRLGSPARGYAGFLWRRWRRRRESERHRSCCYPDSYPDTDNDIDAHSYPDAHARRYTRAPPPQPPPPHPTRPSPPPPPPPPPPAATPGRFEESDVRVTLSPGDWIPADSKFGWSGGTAVRSTGTDAPGQLTL